MSETENWNNWEKTKSYENWGEGDDSKWAKFKNDSEWK